VKQSNDLVRVAKVTAGFLLLPIGVVMIALPGPGLLTIAVGLMLLEGEFSWARKVRTNIMDFARRSVLWFQKASR